MEWAKPLMIEDIKFEGQAGQDKFVVNMTNFKTNGTLQSNIQISEAIAGLPLEFNSGVSNYFFNFFWSIFFKE